MFSARVACDVVRPRRRDIVSQEPRCSKILLFINAIAILFGGEKPLAAQTVQNARRRYGNAFNRANSRGRLCIHVNQQDADAFKSVELYNHNSNSTIT